MAILAVLHAGPSRYKRRIESNLEKEVIHYIGWESEDSMGVMWTTSILSMEYGTEEMKNRVECSGRIKQQWGPKPKLSK